MTHGLVGARCICGWRAALGTSIHREYDKHLLATKKES